MDQLVVRNHLSKVFIETRCGCSQQPITFIEALRRSLHSIRGDIVYELHNGLDKCYVAFFKEILRGMHRINWDALEQHKHELDNVLLDLPAFVFNFIPSVVDHGTEGIELDMQFLPMQEGDISIGTMNSEEVAIFKYAGFADFFTYTLSLDADSSCMEFTRTATLYWVLMWCSIIWRFERAHFLLRSGEYDIEIRQGWKIVACLPKNRVRSI